MPERPEGCCAQTTPGPFSPAKAPRRAAQGPERWLTAELAVQAVVLGGLFFLRFYHVLFSLWNKWKEPTWSHGYLVPLFSLWFLYVRRHKLKQARLLPQNDALVISAWTVGGVLLIGGMVLDFWCSYFWRIDYGRYMGMLVSIFGLALLLGGWRVVKHAWVAVLYLVFMMPVPYQVYERVATPLQELAAGASVSTLNVGQVKAYREGTVIQIPMPQSDESGRPLLDAAGSRVIRDEPLNVAEACSGMRSLMGLLALGVAFAYLSDKPMWQRLTLILSTPPIAVFCNMVRVSGTGLLYRFVDRRWAQGFMHEFHGFVMMGVELAMLFLAGAVLSRLGGKRKDPFEAGGKADAAAQPTAEGALSLLRRPLIVGGIAMLAALGLTGAIAKAHAGGGYIILGEIAAMVAGVCAVGLYERSSRLVGPHAAVREKALLYGGFGAGVAAVLVTMAGLGLLLVRSG